MDKPLVSTRPTRSLIGKKPLHYVSAVNTDIRRTFRRARLLARLQAVLRPALPLVQP